MHEVQACMVQAAGAILADADPDHNDAFGIEP